MELVSIKHRCLVSEFQRCSKSEWSTCFGMQMFLSNEALLFMSVYNIVCLR
jgi:hypothetical protein